MLKGGKIPALRATGEGFIRTEAPRSVGSGTTGYWNYVRNINYFLQELPNFAGSFNPGDVNTLAGRGIFHPCIYLFRHNEVS
jgi:hypothetical protein